MASQPAVNDNFNFSAITVTGDEGFGLRRIGEEEEAVISAAILVATAFKLRDEAALITTLRDMTNAVANLETAEAA